MRLFTHVLTDVYSCMYLCMYIYTISDSVFIYMCIFSDSNVCMYAADGQVLISYTLFELDYHKQIFVDQ